MGKQEEKQAARARPQIGPRVAGEEDSVERREMRRQMLEWLRKTEERYAVVEETRSGTPAPASTADGPPHTPGAA